MDKNFINTDETLEFACVIKNICDEYNIDPLDLRMFPPVDHILAHSDEIRFKKRLAIKIPLHPLLSPKNYKAQLTIIRLRPILSNLPYSLTSDNSQIGKLGVGLGEFELQLKTKKIQFWVWNGAQDYYMFGGSDTYFIHKDNVLALTFYIKRIQHANRPSIDIPILPSEMIAEIYKNSIDFLLKGRDMQDQYKKYRIPYKRGILFSGRPGCVTGDTKIRIRKKSNKGTHKIYDVL